ncbi:MAG: histidinol-phosphate transaminase [Fibrobacter sp.]|nr:histidinol-phosphate transaminase [Fibrobacter sp.]
MIPTRKEIFKLKDYVPGKSIQEIQERTGLKSIIKLASNENPLGPSPKALNVLAKYAQELHLYPIGSSPDLSKALAAKYELNSDQVIVGNGSDEILSLVALAYLEPGTSAVSARETFSVYEFVTLSMGADFKTFPLKNHSFDLEAIATEAQKESTRVVFICNPNNPTGTWSNFTEISEFMDSIPERVLVVMDQAYGEYALEDEYPQMIADLAKYPNLLLVRTFSKIWGLAGLRVGYALGNPDVLQKLWKVKAPFSVNILAQRAAQAALDDGEHLKNSLTANERGKEFLYQSFANMGLEYLPTAANFIAVQIGPRASAVVSDLESRGLIVRSMASFAMPHWIRVTVGTENENKIFIEQLKAVLEQ